MDVGSALGLSLCLLMSAAVLAGALRREKHAHWLTQAFLRKEREDNRILRAQNASLDFERSWLREQIEKMSENAS